MNERRACGVGISNSKPCSKLNGEQGKRKNEDIARKVPAKERKERKETLGQKERKERMELVKSEWGERPNRTNERTNEANERSEREKRAERTPNNPKCTPPSPPVALDQNHRPPFLGAHSIKQNGRHDARHRCFVADSFDGEGM